MRKNDWHPLASTFGRGRRFGAILLWLCIVPLSYGYAQQKAPLSITGVELKKLGEQLNILLILDSTPIYEISANLKQKSLLVKLKNAKIAFPDGKTERLFNDPLIEGIQFVQEGPDVWVKFKTRVDDLNYDVARVKTPGVLEIEFRKTLEVEPLPPPPRPPSLRLLGVRFGMHPPDFSRATFLVSKEPRILIRHDKAQKSTTIRFSDTHPMPGLEETIPEYDDKRIRYVKISKDPNQTFITIDSSTDGLTIKEMFLNDPPRWVVDFYGTPKEKIEAVATDEEEVVEVDEEKAKKAALLAEKEKKRRLRRETVIKSSYDTAEKAFRDGRYKEAIDLFRSTYRIARDNVADFKDELNPLAIQGLFRVADAMYAMLERRGGTNYHQAITAYETGIRIAQESNFPSDLIPHAYFRIGRSYQKMNFHHEANLQYTKLQERFPGSLQASESNFWKAFNQIDRREWRLAIRDFREYLRASPSPKFLARAHYKMAEAYYELKDYFKAKEGFDRGRAIDPKYPEGDPALLFHMGETYYETKDFATAREVFGILLQKYPDADYSKLVALRLGDFLRDEGKEEEAIEVYKNAISGFSRDLALLGKMRIANILSKRPYTEDYKEALKTYDEIIKLYTDSLQFEEAMLRKGLTLTLFGEYIPAIEALEAFAEKFPNNIYVQRGVVQETINENVKGLIDQYFQEKDYLAVTGVDRDYKSLYLDKFPFDTTLFQIGVSYHRLGLFEDALVMYNRLIKEGSPPIQELSRFQAANALAEKRDLPQSRDKFKEFMKLYPESRYDADILKRLAETYRQNRQYTEAAAVYEEAIRKYAQDKDPLKAEVAPSLYYELANLYNDLGRYVDSSQAYDKTIRSYYHPLISKDTPSYVILSHFFKADMLFNVKRDDEALQSYEKALSLYSDREDPDIVERIQWARYQMGVIYQRTGREQKALAIFKKLMEEEAEDKLWKKLAGESHQILTRRLAYEDYLNQ